MKHLVLTAAAAGFALARAALAQDAQKLLKEKACLSCHTVDKKLVGPSYKEVAAKYKAQKDAEGYPGQEDQGRLDRCLGPHSDAAQFDRSRTTRQKHWRNTS